MNQPALQESLVHTGHDMHAAKSLKGLGGEVVVFSTRCPEKETSNEDALAVIPQSDQAGVLVVADGMGGAAAGEQASRLAVECVCNAAGDGTNALLRTAILNGIETANQSILRLGVGAATTLVAVEIQAGVIRPYHVGDSTALVVGQRGKLKLLTVAHGPVSQAVEAGVLDDEEAMRHEDRHLVSNVLGTDEMRIEIGPSVRLARFDTLLLASDGLFDNLSIDEIVARIRKGELLKCVAQLIADVQQRMEDSSSETPGKPDDLTLVAFRRGVDRVSVTRKN